MLCFEEGEELKTEQACFLSGEQTKHRFNHPRGVVSSDRTSHLCVVIIDSAKVENALNTLLVKSTLKTAQKALGKCTVTSVFNMSPYPS